MTGTTRKRRGLSFQSVALALLLAAPMMASAQLVSFELPAQDAATGIPEFARQANLQIIAPADQLHGIKTRAVRGAIDARAALRQMLEGTGLIIAADDGHTISLRFPKPVGPEARNGSESALEEIIVTAQKRTERLTEIPVSIGVQTAADLDKYHPLQMSDYAGYIAGLDVTTGGWPGTNQITLRGLGQQGGDTPVVATYFDDVPIGASGPGALGSVLAPDVNPFDLERIEVLRGPQGTLWGSNSIGGIVRFVLTKPDLNKFGARAGADFINIRHADSLGYIARGALNLPLIEGELAVHASASRTDNPGYIDNAMSGKRSENGESVQSGRLALLWQPSERWSLKAQVLAQHTDAGNTFVTLAQNHDVGGYTNSPGQPLYGDLTTFHAFQNAFIADLQFFSLTLDWQLGIADLVATSGYSVQKFTQPADATDYGRENDVLPVTGVANGFEFTKAQYQVRKLTQEVRLVSPTQQRLQWMIGAFYDRDSVDPFTINQYGYDANFKPIPGFPVLYTTYLPSHYSEAAAYGNVTYQFTKNFDVTAGLRRGVTTSSYSQSVSGPGYDLCCGGPAAVDAAGSSRTNIVGHALTTRYRWQEHGMTYARIATGFRPGGPNILSPAQLAASTAPKQYQSDSDVDYDVGLKVDFLDHRLQVDAALFYIDWTNIQVTAPFTGSDGSTAYVNVNGGKAHSKGAELSLTLLPVRGLQVNATMAHYDPRFGNDNALAGTSKGQLIPGSAQSTASLSVEYVFPVHNSWKPTLGGGLRYKGALIPFPDPAFLDDTRIKASTLVDVNAALVSDRWRVALYARNLADKRDYSSMYSNSSTPSPAYGPAFYGAVTQPRTLGLSVDRSF